MKIQTIGMYAMFLPLLIIFITSPMPFDSDFQESFHLGLFIAFLVMMALMIPVCILNAAISIRSALKGEENPTKPTMKTKLYLIPWYIVNFIIGVLFVAAFFNPFMLFAVPFVVAFYVSMTYIMMLSTSLGDFAYYVRKYIRKDPDVSRTTIFAVALLFLFCLDVIGAIILYKGSKKHLAQARTDAPAE